MPDMLGHTPPRPKRRTFEVVEGACKSLVREVCQWERRSEPEPAAVLAALIHAFDDDAYRFARNLEQRRGWAPDAELVDILDGSSAAARQVHDQIVKDWVAQNHIDCPFALGDRVEAKRFSGLETGTVERINAAMAQIVVRRQCDAPGCGMIVNYEDATAAAEAAS